MYSPSRIGFRCGILGGFGRCFKIFFLLTYPRFGVVVIVWSSSQLVFNLQGQVQNFAKSGSTHTSQLHLEFSSLDH